MEQRYRAASVHLDVQLRVAAKLLWRIDRRMSELWPRSWDQTIKPRLMDVNYRHLVVVDVVGAKNGLPAGRVYRLRHRTGGLARFRQRYWFQAGYFDVLLTRYPAFFARYGMRRGSDGLIEYPDVALLNAILDEEGDTGLRFRIADTVDAVETMEMATHFADEGAISVSLRRDEEAAGTSAAVDYQLHDFFVHVPGYVLLPPSIVAASRERMRLLLALRARGDAPAPHVTQLDRWLRAEVVQLDRTSSAILRLLATWDRRSLPVLSALLFAAGRDVRSVPESLRAVYPAELCRYAEVQVETDERPRPVTRAAAHALARGLLARVEDAQAPVQR
jgi:hypothetical protein